MNKPKTKGIFRIIVGRGSILIFFIMAFEVMIMISPFAFFFYSVFNPVFKWVDQYSATKWLTFFFLPHMILPPTLFLKTVRVLGSLFFIVGAITFIICALQVYLGKIFKWGVVDKGLYKYIRHPQYLALGIWGIGMSILWPRFIVLASLSLMFILYYFLAKDEERRMLSRYGETYPSYMANTGMFFPRCIAARLSFIERLVPRKSLRYVITPIIIVIFVIGSGFVLREITLRSLPFTSENNVTLVSILPEDASLDKNILTGILKSRANGKLNLLKDGKDYLGYVMPPDYIMQGMIANTGGEFHLYKHHHTIAMITDWVLHPFQHLRTSPSFHMAKMHNVDPSIARRHHCPLGIDDPKLDCDTCPYRRAILVEIEHIRGGHISGKGLLAFDTSRIPIYSIDINIRTGKILNANKVGNATAWKDVPTPAI